MSQAIETKLVQTNEGKGSGYWWTELYRLADGRWLTRQTIPFTNERLEFKFGHDPSSFSLGKYHLA